MRSTTRN